VSQVENYIFNCDDAWIVKDCEKVCFDVQNHFAKYEFYSGFHKLNEFIVSRLSSIYFNAIKDRLYCDHWSSPRRISTQATLAFLFKKLAFVLAPIFTSMIDEAIE